MNTTNISKFLSLVLRHQPEKINISLDANGWTDVDILVQQCNEHGVPLDIDLLEEVVFTNDKQRFAFNEDQTLIRANQGHSVSVDLDLPVSIPPGQLYHGTVEKFLVIIQQNGLQKMARQHVHLSRDIETAQKVGSRRGKPVILIIDTQKMQADGFKFYLSNNGVWLTEEVPVQYINFPG